MKPFILCALLVFLLLPGGAFAETDARDAGNPRFTQQELDQMLAPIALYPDALLSQVLMAATYPLEIVQAARWSRENAGLRGDSAVQAVAAKDWDPSVQSLVAFPQVLQAMDQKIEWTERLGDAFLAQQSDVMDTIQALRHKARAAGTLAQEKELVVRDEDDAIVIDPRDSSVVYVPYYDPRVVYGGWWWSDYPPVFWSPWPGYAWYGPYAWGIGIGVGVDVFLGGWDWRHHRVWTHDRRRAPHDGLPGQQPWQHDRDHRRNVPYRNDTLDQRYPRPLPLRPYEPYRGQPPAVTSRPQPQPQNPTRIAEPPARGVPDAPRTTLPGARPGNPNTPPQRVAPPLPSFAQPAARPNAFEGIGQGRAAQDYSARGHASQPPPPPPPPARPPGRKP